VGYGGIDGERGKEAAIVSRIREFVESPKRLDHVRNGRKKSV